MSKKPHRTTMGGLKKKNSNISRWCIFVLLRWRKISERGKNNPGGNTHSMTTEAVDPTTASGIIWGTRGDVCQLELGDGIRRNIIKITHPSKKHGGSNSV